LISKPSIDSSFSTFYHDFLYNCTNVAIDDFKIHVETADFKENMFLLSFGIAKGEKKLYHCSNSLFCIQLLESFQQSFPALSFPLLPERGDFDLKDVLESPYFFN
jgi:DNA-directed RNA polymerase